MIQSFLAELSIKYELSPTALLAAEMAFTILKCLAILVIWLFISAIIRKTLKKAFCSPKRRFSERKANTLYAVTSSLIRYAIYFLIACQILSEFGVGMESILAVAGIGSVAIGFGAQSIVKDFITGLLILMEDQFGVGDTVSINGMTGVCEAIGMRTTHLRAADSSLHIIPNSSITVVTNMSKKPEK